MSRFKLTYANVMATIAVFIALGGSAYAATQLKKNSVGTKQIKNSAVTAAKIKKGTITGTQINLSTLGTVPSSTHATSADSATTIPPAEPIHFVGTPGQPAFEGGSSNDILPVSGVAFQQVGFYKDQLGIVHLEGVAKVGGGNGAIFTLPPGFRPPSGVLQVFEQSKEGGVFVFGTGASVSGMGNGAVFGLHEEVDLSGITYRAGS